MQGPGRVRMFWSRLLSFHNYCTSSWLVCLHVPSNPYISFRMQQPGWSSTYPRPPTLHRSSTPCSGYCGCWNLIQDTGTGLPCCEWLRPILHPGYGQTIYPSPSTSISWPFAVLWNGGMSSPLTSGQKKFYKIHLQTASRPKQTPFSFYLLFSCCSKCST